MRRIYFIRHALPSFPDNVKRCIGLTDIPLGNEGITQCVELQHWAKNIYAGKTVFSSYLQRATQTAKYLTDNPIVVPGLEEMYAGEWEGLSFSEIQLRWPELFDARGKNNVPIPGSEDIEKGLSRFIAAVKYCLDSSVDDIVIVAHSTVIQALISYAESSSLNKYREYTLPYCSVTCLEYDGNFRLVYYGRKEDNLI